MYVCLLTYKLESAAFISRRLERELTYHNSSGSIERHGAVRRHGAADHVGPRERAQSSYHHSQARHHASENYNN